MQRGNPYAPPRSEIDARNTEIRADLEDPPAEPLKKTPVWLVFALLICTFGLYTYVWLISRDDQFRSLKSGRGYSNWFAYISFILVVSSLLMSYSYLEVGVAFVGPGGWLIAWCLAVGAAICLWINLFDVREILRLQKQIEDDEDIEILRILTFFFGIIYLQLVINEHF